jgi:hypothetical protein
MREAHLIEILQRGSSHLWSWIPCKKSERVIVRVPSSGIAKAVGFRANTLYNVPAARPVSWLTGHWSTDCPATVLAVWPHSTIDCLAVDRLRHPHRVFSVVNSSVNSAAKGIKAGTDEPAMASLRGLAAEAFAHFIVQVTNQHIVHQIQSARPPPFMQGKMAQPILDRGRLDRTTMPACGNHSVGQRSGCARPHRSGPDRGHSAVVRTSPDGPCLVFSEGYSIPKAHLLYRGFFRLIVAALHLAEFCTRIINTPATTTIITIIITTTISTTSTMIITTTATTDIARGAQRYYFYNDNYYYYYYYYYYC